MIGNNFQCCISFATEEVSIKERNLGKCAYNFCYNQKHDTA